MAQSYCHLLYHAVFSTQYRRPWLASEIRPRIHQYLGGLINARKGVPIIINGTMDHVHLMMRLHQTSVIADVLRDIKAVSSGWVHDTFPGMREFAWQGGNGVFTVSASGFKKLHQYIENQEEHHKTMSFETEFKALLSAHGIPFDQRYLFEDESNDAVMIGKPQADFRPPPSEA